MLSLVVLMVLFIGVNQSNAQVEPCECYGEIIDAVDQLETDAGDADLKIPFCLTFQASRLEDICDGTATFPCSAEVIINRMLTVVDNILTTDWPYCWPDEIPEDVEVQLDALKILLEGCLAE